MKRASIFKPNPAIYLWIERVSYFNYKPANSLQIEPSFHFKSNAVICLRMKRASFKSNPAIYLRLKPACIFQSNPVI